MKKTKKHKGQNRPPSAISPKNNVKKTGEKSQKGEEEDKKLKKADRITAVSVIVTIISIIVTILVYWQPKNEEETLTEEISNNIVEIEETFDLSALDIDILSSPDIQLVKEFQTSARKLVVYWKSMSNARPIEDFETLDPQEILDIAESRLDERDSFAKETSEIQTYIQSIIDYGRENNIPYYTPKEDRLKCLQILESRRNPNTSSERGTISWMRMSLACSEAPSDYSKSKMIRDLKEKERAYKSKAELDYVNTFFLYLIEFNSKYMEHINECLKKSHIQNLVEKSIS